VGAYKHNGLQAKVDLGDRKQIEVS